MVSMVSNVFVSGLPARGSVISATGDISGYDMNKRQAHLTRRNKLQWPQRTPHIGNVRLEIVERVGDASLQLGRVLPRRAVGRDLVKSSHDCSCWTAAPNSRT